MSPLVTLVVATLIVGQVVSRSTVAPGVTRDATNDFTRDATNAVTRAAKANVTRGICGRVSIEFFQPQQVHLALAGDHHQYPGSIF